MFNQTTRGAVLTAALIAPVFSLTACGGSDTAAPASTASVTASSAASTAAATPSASESWDCSPSSTLSQGDWTQHCQDTDNSKADGKKVNTWVSAGQTTTSYVVDFSKPAEGDLAKEYRAFLKAHGKPNAEVYAVKIDNMVGDQSARLRDVAYATSEGDEVHAMEGTLSDLVPDLETAANDDEYNNLVEEFSGAIDLGEKNKGTYMVGAKGTWLVVFEKAVPARPADVARVVVVDDYYTDIELVRA